MCLKPTQTKEGVPKPRDTPTPSKVGVGRLELHCLEKINIKKSGLR